MIIWKMLWLKAVGRFCIQTDAALSRELGKLLFGSTMRML